VEDRCLRLGGKGLLEDSERLPGFRQRLLTLERCPILEHLDGDERVGVGEVPAMSKLTTPSTARLGAIISPNTAITCSVFSGWHCTLKRTTIIVLPPGFVVADDEAGSRRFGSEPRGSRTR